MNQRRVKFLLSILILVHIMSACNAAAPEEPVFPPVTVIAEPTSSSRNSNVLQSEAEVPRIPIEQALAALQSGAAMIVDVRSAQAYEANHVKGAISIPLAEIETNIEGLTLEKDQWIITYCTWQNEHTSARAAFVMINNGYTNVAAMLGGFQSWVEAGYPIEP